jgi:hypothetical protein
MPEKAFVGTGFMNLPSPYYPVGWLFVLNISKTKIACLLALFLISPMAGYCIEAGESRISCFVIGVVDLPRNPFTGFFIRDPLYTYRVEPLNLLSIDEKRKLDRVYYPRNRKALVDGYDVLILFHARIDHFTTTQINDLDYAFREAGMVGIVEHGLDWHMVWTPTILYQLTPIRDLESYKADRWRPAFRREREPVFLPFLDLGIESVIGVGRHTLTLKQGATTWADSRPRDLPFISSWRPGGGDPGILWETNGGFAEWCGVRVSDFGRADNPYAIDLVTNMILYSLDRELLIDVFARREARSLLSISREQKLLVFHMIDWADRFGANTLSVSSRLTDLEQIVEEATSSYLDQDYQTTISKMASVSSGIEQALNEAMSAKNEALFWVYTSEWLAVTASAILSGFVLWSLMIGRRLYKPVEVSRPVRSSD